MPLFFKVLFPINNDVVCFAPDLRHLHTEYFQSEFGIRWLFLGYRFPCDAPILMFYLLGRLRLRAVERSVADIFSIAFDQFGLGLVNLLHQRVQAIVIAFHFPRVLEVPQFRQFFKRLEVLHPPLLRSVPPWHPQFQHLNNLDNHFLRLSFVVFAMSVSCKFCRFSVYNYYSIADSNQDLLNPVKIKVSVPICVKMCQDSTKTFGGHGKWIPKR